MKTEEEYIKHNLMARIAFRVFSKTCFSYLESIYGKTNMKIIRKKSRQKYREILSRTPTLGKYSAMILMPVVMFAVYQAVEEGMEESVFAEMLDRVSHTPLFLKMVTKKELFTEKFHMKTQKLAALSRSLPYPVNWEFRHEVINEDEYITTYSRCGICELARQENCFELARYFCRIDAVTYDIMGAVLDRKKTIANGDEICDFHIIKKTCS